MHGRGWKVKATLVVRGRGGGGYTTLSLLICGCGPLRSTLPTMQFPTHFPLSPHPPTTPYPWSAHNIRDEEGAASLRQ
jgi:hypothetical protein